MHARFKSMQFILIMALAVAFFAICAGSLAMAAGDTTMPVVTNVVPADGSTIYANGTGTTYYQLGNTTPLVIKADYSDEVGGSGVDVASVMVHLDGSNMIEDNPEGGCLIQSASHVECTATAADLTPGLHPIDVYVSDLDGNLNTHRTWVTIVVDSAAPTYSNLTPADGSTILTSQLNSTSTNDPGALRFDYDLTDPAPSSGWSPMTHVNESVAPGVPGAMIMQGCVKTPSATNPTHYSCQVNRAKLLKLGDNTLSILLKDKVGNTSSDYSNTSTLKHYTVVDDVDPVVSGVTADTATITAAYTDPAPTGALSTNLTSGINSATAMVQVDGATIMMGCTTTATGISCPTPTGLSNGTHTVKVMVSDNASNEGIATGSLTVCNPAKPSLVITRGAVGWGSFANYSARLLTVRFIISNNGASGAYGVAFTGSTANNGVTLETATPWNLGDLTAGANVEFPVVYHVPTAVGSFKPSVTASATDACGSSYTYP